MGSIAYTVSSRRFLVLITYGLVNLTNGMLWVTFSPISDLVDDYFDDIGLTAVNMLGLVWCIGYLPGTVIGIMAIKKFDLRGGLLMGSALTVLGTIMRVIGCSFRGQLGASGSYILVLFGQILGSLAQPVFANTPAILASTWFSLSERDLATTAASLFNLLGTALGQLMPAMFVKRKGGGSDIEGMADYMLVQMGICAVAFILALFFLYNKPSTPPSHSSAIRGSRSSTTAALRAALLLHCDFDNGVFCEGAVIKDDAEPPREKPETAVASSEIAHNIRKISIIECEYDQLIEEIMSLRYNKGYLVLFLVFSVVFGTFSTVITLLNQILDDHGYTNDDAGNFGASLIFAGMISAGVCGFYLDRTHLYREALVCSVIIAILFLTFFFSMIYKDNFILLFIATGLLGAGIVF